MTALLLAMAAHNNLTTGSYAVVGSDFVRRFRRGRFVAGGVLTLTVMLGSAFLTPFLLRRLVLFRLALCTLEAVSASLAEQNAHALHLQYRQ